MNGDEVLGLCLDVMVCCSGMGYVESGVEARSELQINHRKFVTTLFRSRESKERGSVRVKGRKLVRIL